MTTIRGSFCLHVSRCHVSLTIVALAVVLLSGCDQSGSQEGVPLARSSTLKVNVFAPERVENAQKTANYFGKLKANRKATLGFSVAGQVASLPRLQQRFESGDTIAKLDSSELDSQRESITSAIEQSIRGGSGTERTQQLRAQLAELDAQIQQLSIIAPFRCIVERLHANTNGIVSPQSPIVTILETSVKVEMNIPRRIATLVKPAVEYDFELNGQEIRCILREGGVAFSENPPGHVQLTFDIKPGTVLDDNNFFIDQTIEAKFRFETGQSGYWLPISSLVQNNNGTWSLLIVETINESSIVVELPIDIALIREDRVLCTTDLAGKLAVRDGVHRVVAGQRVESILKIDPNLSPADASQ